MGKSVEDPKNDRFPVPPTSTVTPIKYFNIIYRSNDDLKDSLAHFFPTIIREFSHSFQMHTIRFKFPSLDRHVRFAQVYVLLLCCVAHFLSTHLLSHAVRRWTYNFERKKLL
jgi:hypothetical protein